MKKEIKHLLTLAIIFATCIGTGIDVNAQRRTTNKAPRAKTTNSATTAKSVCLNLGADTWGVTYDDKNVYVAMAWCKYFVAIDKATGNISKIEAPGEVQSVEAFGHECYYYVVTKGIYKYDSATGQSSGPLFDGITVSYDSSYPVYMSLSPNHRYLYCAGSVVELATGTVSKSGAAMGFSRAVNNMGGGYFGCPEATYCPLGGKQYVLSNRVVVRDIFADPLTGNAYFSCDNGVGYTPEVPAEGAGLKRINTLPEGLNVDCISRDDRGNFIFGLRDGLAIGGKSMDAPLTLYTPLMTGVSVYGSELKLSSANIITADGHGNIIAASTHNDFLIIFNPSGLKGYSKIKGKHTRL